MIETKNTLYEYKIVLSRECIEDDCVDMLSALTLNGKYIGSPKMAEFLVRKGIFPETIDDSHRVCSIGYNYKENKWCGWSHRALACFGVGDKLFVEDFELDKVSDKELYEEYIKDWENNDKLGYKEEYVPFVLHGYKTIENTAEARQAAINFAKYIA